MQSQLGATRLKTEYNCASIHGIPRICTRISPYTDFPCMCVLGVYVFIDVCIYVYICICVCICYIYMLCCQCVDRFIILDICSARYTYVYMCIRRCMCICTVVCCILLVTYVFVSMYASISIYIYVYFYNWLYTCSIVYQSVFIYMYGSFARYFPSPKRYVPHDRILEFNIAISSAFEFQYNTSVTIHK